jgi:hypothetical protein
VDQYNCLTRWGDFFKIAAASKAAVMVDAGEEHDTVDGRSEWPIFFREFSDDDRG